MPPSLQFGQIVWAEIADANGIRKARPAVVITPTRQLTPGGRVTVIAITSQVPQHLPDDHVLLPWHPRGHPRTGLNRKCAAVCSWVRQIAARDVQSVVGVVPGAVLLTILSKMGSAPPPGQATPP